MKNLLLLSMLFFAFSNCNSTKTTQKEANNALKEELKNGTYTVVKLYENSIADSNPTISINVDEKSVSGFSGCNTYTCSYEKTEETMNFQYPIATKRYCPNQPKLEGDFFKALSETKKMQNNKDQISLLDRNGKEIVLAKIQ